MPSIPPRPTRAVQRAIPTTPIITFDAGQTLIELDLDFLARRLGERGVAIAPDALGAAAPAAWARYDQLVREGGGHPWRALMTTLLQGAGVADVSPLVEWLWDEQPRANLWRKPIPAMVDLARELAGRGAKLAVLSNSEGRLAELLAEIGIADPFTAIVDSGRVGFEKPDRRIFAHTLTALGVTAIDLSRAPVHIGDLWVADVAAARAVGWRAIWFGRHATPVDDPGIACAHDATEARAALVRFGVL